VGIFVPEGKFVVVPTLLLLIIECKLNVRGCILKITMSSSVLVMIILANVEFSLGGNDVRASAVYDRSQLGPRQIIIDPVAVLERVQVGPRQIIIDPAVSERNQTELQSKYLISPEILDLNEE
jgi:hypothetical protein